MQNWPVSVAAAIGAVLSSGVALIAIFVPGLTDVAQVAIIAFGNSVVALGVLLVQLMNSTSNTDPVLPEGTAVKVVTPAGSPDRIVKL